MKSINRISSLKLIINSSSKDNQNIVCLQYTFYSYFDEEIGIEDPALHRFLGEYTHQRVELVSTASSQDPPTKQPPPPSQISLLQCLT